MNINKNIIRQRILDKHAEFNKDAKIGVISSFCKQQRLDEKTDMIYMIATTNDVDLDSEVVIPSGANLDYFMKNASIFVDHNYEVEHCVGKMRHTVPFMGSDGIQSGWKIAWQLYPLTKNKYVEDLRVFAKEGDLSCSIGFRADDQGPPTREEAKRYTQGDKTPSSIVRSWLWLETSITFLPCNISAQQVGFSSAEQKEYKDEIQIKRLEKLHSLTRKGSISEATAKIFGLNDEKRRKSKKTIVWVDNN